MKNKLVSILILCLLLTGCSRPVREAHLENKGLVGIIGFDLADSGKTKVTVALPQLPHAFSEQIEFYTTEVDLTREALVEITRKSDKVLTYAHLQAILFSEEYAKKRGIKQEILNAFRNPNIGDDVYIAVTEGTTEELMMLELENHPSIIRYITDLLEPWGQTTFNPFVTLHDFVYKMTSKVEDPMVPYLKKAASYIEISGIALFKEDKMLEVLSHKESRTLEGLTRHEEFPPMKLATDEKDDEGNPLYVMLELIKSSTKMKSNKDLNSPEVFIHISLVGSLYDYAGKRDLDNPEEMQEFIEVLNQSITQRTNELFEKLQALEVDPLAIGQLFRIHHRGQWSKEEWRKVLPKVKFHVQTDLRKLNTGTLD